MVYLADLTDNKKAVDQQVLKEISLGHLIALVPLLVEAIRKGLCKWMTISQQIPDSS